MKLTNKGSRKIDVNKFQNIDNRNQYKENIREKMVQSKDEMTTETPNTKWNNITNNSVNFVINTGAAFFILLQPLFKYIIMYKV